ncbi:MAG TPA: hypothetical protein VFA90_10825 [Terriglobales bacterium]|nr:hypothetical protein [Terriglobales bacterium]
MRRFPHLCALLVVLGAAAHLHAQDDDVSLGDLARAVRNSRPAEQSRVIDNDNLDRIMDKAESERLDGQPVISITHTGALVAVSADGTCSLSFDGKTANRTAAAYISADLPQSELVKLEGPAAIENGELLVSIHNATQWELKEVEVGVTVTQAQSSPPEYRFATLQSVPVAPSEKLPDPTVLYHLRGTATPNSTSTFRVLLDDSIDLSAGKDWHWSIVGARGIPPAAQALTASGSAAPDPPLVAPMTALQTETLPADADQPAEPKSPLVTNSSNPAQH